MCKGQASFSALKLYFPLGRRHGYLGDWKNPKQDQVLENVFIQDHKWNKKERVVQSQQPQPDVVLVLTDVKKSSYHEGRLAAYSGHRSSAERMWAKLGICHSALLGFFWLSVPLAFPTSLLDRVVFYLKIQTAFSWDPTLSLGGVTFLKQLCLRVVECIFSLCFHPGLVPDAE